MRRRDLLAGTAMAATGALLPLAIPVHASGAPASTVEDVLFGRLTAPPLEPSQLGAQIAAARSDFAGCRYSQLAVRLPRLLAGAIATNDASTEDRRAAAAGQLAQAYCFATQLLVKLHDDAMACATSDRAVQAATASGDPLIRAEASRRAATVLRRTHHRDSANRLILDAAARLQQQTGLNDTTTSSTYGQLLAVAAYTAAIQDQRDDAWTLLREAEAAISRTGGTANGPFNLVELSVYRVSLSRVLGDFGAAVDYARLVDPARITAPERRARYWQDTALALHGRGRPAAVFQILLSAERDTPQEIRYRPWAQQLTQDLLASKQRSSLPGLDRFASRVGAT